MADLTGITELNFTGLMRGAYKDPIFQLEGVEGLASLVEIIEWLAGNGGGGGGISIYGEFDDDAAAAAGGVPLNGYYIRTIESGFEGLVKKRVI